MLHNAREYVPARCALRFQVLSAASGARELTVTGAPCSGAERVVGLVLVLKEHRSRVEAYERVLLQAEKAATSS